jgi:pyruvate dehydrogenase E2 component (dihydrolipoamide acetyltransferase)
MEKEIKLPKVAEGVESATVTDILVKDGDEVTKGQSVIVVESDKASVEVPSEEAGKVKTISVKKDAEIKPGDVILILETEGKEEQPKEEEKEVKPKEKKKDDEESQRQNKEEAKVEAKEKKPAETTGEEEPLTKEEVKEEPAAEIAAIPNALRLARELGININDVKGSGPQGKIMEEDVTAYVKEIIQGKLKGSPGEEPLPDFSKWGETEKMPLKSIRKATAKRTATTWRIIPHVTHFDEAEISKIEELRMSKNNLAEKKGGKLTITAILLKILSLALKEFPKFNASIDLRNEEIILKKYIHIGVAVDTERGLLVPVVRDVDKKDLIDISIELTALSEKARQGKLSADEMNGGSFVISNVGGIGGTNFTQLVYHPQVAILGVAKAETKAVFINNEFRPKHMVPLSLSYDHRIIDGADAARFMRWICEVIENPLNLFINE